MKYIHLLSHVRSWAAFALDVTQTCCLLGGVDRPQESWASGTHQNVIGLLPNLFDCIEFSHVRLMGHIRKKIKKQNLNKTAKFYNFMNIHRAIGALTNRLRNRSYPKEIIKLDLHNELRLQLLEMEMWSFSLYYSKCYCFMDFIGCNFFSLYFHD